MTLRAASKQVADVVSAQTALATGEVDIIVGDGDWLTAVLAAENPNLDWTIPAEGALRWAQSIGVLAYSLAATIAFRVPARWQRLALLLTVLPFWTSDVVRSYSWLLVLGQNGVVNKALLGLGVLAEPLEISSTRAATVIGFAHFFVMQPTLKIYANLIQPSPNYARAAQDLGASRWQTFARVTLPLTLPQLMMLQLGRSGSLPLASALSVVLMAVVTLAYFASSRRLRLDWI